MFYSDDFIETVKADPVKGTIEICQRAFNVIFHSGDWTQEDKDIMQEAYAMLWEMRDADLLPIAIEFPELPGEERDDCIAINNFLVNLHKACIAEERNLRLRTLRSRFRVGLGSAFAYEFSQGDLEHMQNLINRLRELIANSNKLERDHQQRLLRRIEKLQNEMHKKVSDLDRFWGLIGDAGVVLGKLGNDAKPIVDRIREIAAIVWQTQSRAEELPSGTQLPSLEQKPHSEIGQVQL